MKTHGICVPLFSLHTKNSFGIGEFLDLIPLIDWCKSVGFNVIQLLPLNDTGGKKSPYDALSVFALNPIHISLWPYTKVPDAAKKLNQLPHVDYKQVIALKNQIFKEIYREFDSKKEDFLRFQEENPWLQAYEKVQPHGAFLQYLAFSQMQKVKAHAEKQGVLLKGDIPILLSKKSVDVIEHPDLFLTHLDAGCPPDKYIPQGQNWHFPLYNWQEAFEPVCHFWQKRLKTAEKLYHLYRLDHVVGIFRIWAIPLGCKAMQGHFIPAQKNKWLAQGKNVIESLLKASNMQPIAEDLGTVPKEVRDMLTRLGVPGTKVLRWARVHETKGRYLSKEEYPTLSMTTVSTHDTETLAEWWQQRPDEAKPFAKLLGMRWKPQLSKEERAEILKFSHETNSQYHINLLQEYLALDPKCVSKKLSDERINHPGRQVKANWCYRFKPSVEELDQISPLIQNIKS